MKPVRLFFGLVFVGMAVLAVLDAAGTVAWSRTFEEWWPLAIVGWGAASMFAHRRVSLGGAIVAVVGLTLLADEQGWAAEPLVWSVLFLLVGAAILYPGAHRDSEKADDRGATRPIEPASQH